MAPQFTFLTPYLLLWGTLHLAHKFLCQNHSRWPILGHPLLHLLVLWGKFNSCTPENSGNSVHLNIPLHPPPPPSALVTSSFWTFSGMRLCTFQILGLYVKVSKWFSWRSHLAWGSSGGGRKSPTPSMSTALRKLFLTQQSLLIHLPVAFSLYHLAVGTELKVAQLTLG